MRTIARRPTLAAAATFALLALLFVSPALPPGRTLSNSDSFWFQPPWINQRPAGLVRPSNPEVDDAPAVLQPFVQYTRSVLPHIPLWNPYIAGGRPFLADAQSAVFSPFSVPAYVVPFYRALAWIAALKLFLAGFGAFLVGRALGMRFGGAMLAGVVYAFNLWLVCWLAYPHASVWSLIPWLLLCTERVIRRPDPLTMAAFAGVVGVQFLAGHPESSFDALVVTGLFALMRLAHTRRAGRAIRAPVIWLLAGGALGTALAALVLLPFAQLLFGSADIHQRAGQAIHEKVMLQYALGILMPHYWGDPTETPLQLFLLARAVYAGALPLMLSLVALLTRPRGIRLATALLGAAALMVVFGIPPVFQIVAHLPIFSSGHNTRLIIVYMLCIALLAGWGLDEVSARALVGRRRNAALIFAGVLVVAPVIYMALRGSTSWSSFGRAIPLALGTGSAPPATAPGAPDAIRLAALLTWVVFAGAAALLLILSVLRRVPVVAWAVLAVALTFADLGNAGIGYNPAIPERDASQPATGAIRYLESQRPARFVSVSGTFPIPQDSIPMRFQLYEARGYDLPIPQRYDHFWRTQLSPEFPSQVGPYPQNIPLSLPKVTPSRLRALSLLGVTDVLQAAGQPLLRVPGLSLVYGGPDARVYRNADALPRVFVAGAQRPEGGAARAFDATVALGRSARGVAVTETRIPSVPVEAGPTAPAGSARIVDYQAERVEVRATASRPGLLVLDDNQAPGWGATLDGRPVSIHTTDYLFRGVVLPTGTHTVVFTYRPVAWRIGWITSAVALLLLALSVAFGWRVRRRATPVRGARPREPEAVAA